MSIYRPYWYRYQPKPIRVAERAVIGDKILVILFQCRLDYRVTTGDDIECAAVIQIGACPAQKCGIMGMACGDIEQRQQMAHRQNILLLCQYRAG